MMFTKKLLKTRKGYLLIFSTFLLLQVLACSKFGLTPGAEVASSSTSNLKLVIVGGNDQTALPGATLYDSLTVKVVDQGDNPVPGTQVTFSKLDSNSVISAVEGVTDQDGTLKIQLSIGNMIAGNRNTVSANIKSFPGIKVDFSTKVVSSTEIDDWLADHAPVANAIIWPNQQRINLPYNQWNATQKTELYWFFEKARKDWLTVVDVPTALQDYNATSTITVLYTPRETWLLYLDNIATSLHLEIDDLVNWSVLAYSATELKMIFDANEFYIPLVNGSNKYAQIIRGAVYNTSVQEPGTYLRSFMKEIGGIKTSRLATIGALLNWSKDLYHFGGAIELSNMYNHWQYGSVLPSRIINGTTVQNNNLFGHFTAGCHGTNAFLKIVLRALNIPVKIVLSQDRHSQAYFPTEALYMAHGDDPYNFFSRITPVISLENMLIDIPTYNSWFTGTAPKSVASGIVAFAIRNLSNNLIYQRAQEPVNTPHSTSKVYNLLKTFHTLQELETMQIWDRLDAKIDSLGGRSNIPAALIGKYN